MQAIYKSETPEDSTDDKLSAVHPDLTEELLRSSAYRAFAEHGVGVSEFAPPSTIGQIMYLFTTENLREGLAHFPGWRAVNTKNICRSVHEASGISVVCSGGDEFTGSLRGTPSTKARKGPAAEVLYGQTSMFDVPGFEVPETQIWVLLLHVDRRDQEIRCELSLPQEIKNNNQITKWLDRIILEPISLRESLEVDSIEDYSTNEIDVPIEIKRAI